MTRYFKSEGILLRERKGFPSEIYHLNSGWKHNSVVSLSTDATEISEAEAKKLAPSAFALVHM